MPDPAAPHPLPEEVDGIFVGGATTVWWPRATWSGWVWTSWCSTRTIRTGGGVTTEEVTLPLFEHHLHAFFVRWTSEDRMRRDLGLHERQQTALYPEVPNAVPFDGGRDALLNYLDVADRSAFDAFESEPLRAMGPFNVAVRGYLPSIDVPGTGYVAALALVDSHGGRLIEGGSEEMAKALTRSVYNAGGRLATRARVGPVDVRDGRAVGVQKADGRRVRTREFVVSNVPADQTLLDLVGKGHLDTALADELRAHRGLEEGLFGAHYAWSRRPTFASAFRHPELPSALNFSLGYEPTSDLLDDMHAIRAGEVADHTAIHASIPTVQDAAHDPPAGHHTTFGWQSVASNNPDGGDKVRDASDDTKQTSRITDLYRRYSSDFDDCVAVASHSPTATGSTSHRCRGVIATMAAITRTTGGEPTSPLHVERTRAGCGAVPLCREPTSRGSLNGTSGCNAAGATAEDLGVPTWWELPDARTVLEKIKVEA